MPAAALATPSSFWADYELTPAPTAVEAASAFAPGPGSPVAELWARIEREYLRPMGEAAREG